MTNTSSFLCIGHRGASGHAPENTLKAFDLAIDMGCQAIELDVYCIEGELIVIHDDQLERTTNGHGAVENTSLAILRTLDAGKGEQIPTLREVINLVDHRATIHIELKGKKTAIPTNALITEFIDNGWTADEFLISSFNHKELSLADPCFRRGALFYKPAENLFDKTTSLNAYSINLSQALTSSDIVIEAHKLGLKVFVYTVNTQQEMQTLKEMGVDGVFTNFPDKFPTNK